MKKITSIGISLFSVIIMLTSLVMGVKAETNSYSELLNKSVRCTNSADELLCDMFNTSSVDFTDTWASTLQSSYTSDSIKMTATAIDPTANNLIRSQTNNLDGTSASGFTCEWKSFVYVTENDNGYFEFGNLTSYEGGFSIRHTDALGYLVDGVSCAPNVGDNNTYGIHIYAGGNYEARCTINGIEYSTITGTNTFLNKSDMYFKGFSWNSGRTDTYYVSCWNGNYSDAPYNNSLPIIVNLTITPLPAIDTDNLTVVYNVTDVDVGQTLSSQIHWFINDVMNGSLENLTSINESLTNGNDNITVMVRGFDGLKNGVYVNSSVLNIGDATAPVFLANSTNVASVTVNYQISIIVNISDSGSSVNVVRVEVEDPNGLKSNLTMSLASGSSDVGQVGEYQRTYTPGIVGTFYVKFFASDGSGNLGSTVDRILSFDVVAALSGGGGWTGGGGGSTGGGGGSTTVIVDSSNQTAELMYSVSNPYSFNILYTPGTQTKNIRITNIGNKAFNGDIIIGEQLKPYLVVNVCDLLTNFCTSSSTITIPARQAVILKLDLTFIDRFAVIGSMQLWYADNLAGGNERTGLVLSVLTLIGIIVFVAFVGSEL